MRTYHVLGVPLRTGSLYPGSENDAQPYRDVHLLTRLTAAGCDAIDEGNVAIPSYLPHHSIPPIRSWPGPRIAWDCVSERVLPYLQQPGHVPLLIGCDCSIVVGTTQALMRVAGSDVYVVYVDGDFDDAPPDPAKCQSAAAMALWLLTHGAPFRAGPALPSSRVSVLGWTQPAADASTGSGSRSLEEIRRLGPVEAVRQTLAAIPETASIILHFDIDVYRKADMPVSYFPHEEGLTASEGAALVGTLLKDPRIRVVEVTEYAALRDLDHRGVTQIVDVLCDGLSDVENRRPAPTSP